MKDNQVIINRKLTRKNARQNFGCNKNNFMRQRPSESLPAECLENYIGEHPSI